MAELADHEGWDHLIAIAKATKHDDDLVKRFEIAIEEENDHLRKVRKWVAAGHGHGS